MDYQIDRQKLNDVLVKKRVIMCPVCGTKMFRIEKGLSKPEKSPDLEMKLVNSLI
jgi:hypothetical protein